MSEERKISNRQMQALILTDSLGIAIIVLPLGTTLISGASSWIFVFLGVLIQSVIMAMAVSLGNVANWLVEKKLGNIVAFLMCIKMVYCGGLWLRYFSETLNQLLLPKTSIALISILILLAVIYGACKGIECRGRLAEIVIIIIFLVLCFIFALSAQNVKLENFKPFYIEKSWAAIVYTISAGFGFEYLFLESSHIVHMNGKKTAKSAFLVGLIGAILLGGITAFTVGVFGVEGTTERRWAVLQIMDTIDFPLMLLERQDFMMMGFWITSLFAFLSGAVFFSGNLLSRIIVKRDRFIPMFIFIAIMVFLVSFLDGNMVEVSEAIERSMKLNLATEGFIILAFLFGRRKKI